MVVNPKQLLDRSVPALMLKSLENEIDETLKEGFKGEPVFMLIPDWFFGMNKDLADTLFDAYRKEGWEVKKVFDQDKGDFLVFNCRERPARKLREQARYDLQQAYVS